MNPTTYLRTLEQYRQRGVEPIHEFIERQKMSGSEFLHLEDMSCIILAKVKNDLICEGAHPIEVITSLIHSNVEEDVLDLSYNFFFDEVVAVRDMTAKCNIGDNTLAESIAYLALIKSCEINGVPAVFARPVLFDFCFKKGGADIVHLTQNNPPDYQAMDGSNPTVFGFWGMVIFTGLISFIETVADAGLDINTPIRKVPEASGDQFMDPMSFALWLCPGYDSAMALMCNGIKVQSPSYEMWHTCTHICAYQRVMERGRAENTSNSSHLEMVKRLNGTASTSFRKMLEHGYFFGVEEFMLTLEFQSMPHLKEMIRHMDNQILIDWVIVSVGYEKAYSRLTKRHNDVRSRKTFVGKWFFDNCEPLHQAQIDKKREEQKQQRKEALEKKKAAQEAERVETKRRQEAALQEQRTRLEERRQQIQAEERRQTEEQARQQALEREQTAKQEEEKRMAEQKRAEFFERIDQVKKMNADKEQQRKEHLEKQTKEAEETERRALAVQRKQQEKLAEIERAKDLKLKAADSKAKKVERAQGVKITFVSPPRVFSAPTKALLSNMASSNKQPTIPEEHEDDDTKSTFSIATTAVPLPHPTHHFGERVEERSGDMANIPDLAHEIKWTLKHGAVAAGNKANTVVHRGRNGGLDIVTDKSASVAVSVWPAARPPSPAGSHKSTCSIASSSSIKSSASSQMSSMLASSMCLKCDSKSRDFLACVACFHISLCADCATDEQTCMCCNQTLGYRRVFVA